jgi:hypothetical protein
VTVDVTRIVAALLELDSQIGPAVAADVLVAAGVDLTEQQRREVLERIEHGPLLSAAEHLALSVGHVIYQRANHHVPDVELLNRVGRAYETFRLAGGLDATGIDAPEATGCTTP